MKPKQFIPAIRDLERHPNFQRFSHRAMATIFEIFVFQEDQTYVEQAVWAVFEEIDRLEQELSRFIENSDISRINALMPQQSVRVGPDAFECIRQCQRLYQQTNKAFDINAGEVLGCWLNHDKSPRQPTPQELEMARKHAGMHHLRLHESEFAVEIGEHPVKIDLGGFGKGYALDRAADLLAEWDIDAFLIHGGSSTVLAKGRPPGLTGWPVTISDPAEAGKILLDLQLHDMALSGSGLQKGRHIIDPRSGYPVAGKMAAWALADNGASSDALSTAFMIMSPDEIQAYFQSYAGHGHPGSGWGGIIIPTTGEEKEEKGSGKIIAYGSFKTTQIYPDPPA